MQVAGGCCGWHSSPPSVNILAPLMGLAQALSGCSGGPRSERGRDPQAGDRDGRAWMGQGGALGRGRRGAQCGALGPCTLGCPRPGGGHRGGSGLWFCCVHWATWPGQARVSRGWGGPPHPLSGTAPDWSRPWWQKRASTPQIIGTCMAAGSPQTTEGAETRVGGRSCPSTGGYVVQATPGPTPGAAASGLISLRPISVVVGGIIARTCTGTSRASHSGRDQQRRSLQPWPSDACAGNRWLSGAWLWPPLRPGLLPPRPLGPHSGGRGPSSL